uniref:Major intrinsic protein n=1 Tax=viral metagenome TaxID=1070528 RepID=A0A6C0JUI1_9ZZZZ
MIQKVLMEYIGTLFFLYVIIATSGNAIAIAAALAIAILIGGPISGANYNPAVTIMMAYAKKMPMSQVAPYIIAQVAGGITAFEIWKRIKM